MAEENSRFMTPSLPMEEDITPSIGTMGRLGGNTISWRNFLCKAGHPVASFFHLIFKSVALALYIFGSFFGMQYVTVFVLSVLCLAFDFWTVKNVSGRLLVGLRWWVNIKDDGSNEWSFETAPPGTKINAIDSRVFWWSLYGAPIVWFAFALVSFLSLSLDWLLINAVAIALTGSNLVGYLKCSSDAQKKLKESLASGAMKGLSIMPGNIPAFGTSMLAMLGAGAKLAGGNTNNNTAAAAVAPPVNNNAQPSAFRGHVIEEEEEEEISL